MPLDESIGSIIKQIYTSEIVSILFNFVVGTILALLIYPTKYFFVLIIIITPLLSVRGNISGSFTARIARDLLIGDFNTKSVFQNILGTLILTLTVSLFVGIFGNIIASVLIPNRGLSWGTLFTIPFFVMILTSTFSIPCSIGMSYFVFKRGLAPNNIVPPIMTSIDDILIILSIYLALVTWGINA